MDGSRSYGPDTTVAQSPIEDNLGDAISVLAERIEQTRQLLDRLLTEFEERTDRMVEIRNAFSAYRTQPRPGR